MVERIASVRSGGLGCFRGSSYAGTDSIHEVTRNVMVRSPRNSQWLNTTLLIAARVRGKAVWFLKEFFFRADIMSLDHAIQRLTIDSKHARGRLLIAPSVRQHARHMAPLNLSQRRPRLFFRRFCRVCLNLVVAPVMEIADAFRKVLNPDQSVAHRRRPDHRI